MVLDSFFCKILIKNFILIKLCNSIGYMLATCDSLTIFIIISLKEINSKIIKSSFFLLNFII